MHHGHVSAQRAGRTQDHFAFRTFDAVGFTVRVLSAASQHETNRSGHHGGQRNGRLALKGRRGRRRGRLAGWHGGRAR